MKRNYFIVALVFLTFFVISFITNILGALVPDIKSTFSLSYSMVALLPFWGHPVCHIPDIMMS